MTEDLEGAYQTIDSLQLRGEYDAIRELAQYAIDAILNDCEPLNLRTHLRTES
ncbi:MAG: hypothetical protein LBU23_13335 [Planctomycetota bacterium]|jgi:hypothetical protein|nr:hypothetical protein [Planctomycetota bacterium]